MPCVYLKNKICLRPVPTFTLTLPPTEPARYKPTDEELKTLCQTDNFTNCPKFKQTKKILETKSR